MKMSLHWPTVCEEVPEKVGEEGQLELPGETSGVGAVALLVPPEQMSEEVEEERKALVNYQTHFVQLARLLTAPKERHWEEVVLRMEVAGEEQGVVVQIQLAAAGEQKQAPDWWKMAAEAEVLTAPCQTASGQRELVVLMKEAEVVEQRAAPHLKSISSTP